MYNCVCNQGRGVPRSVCDQDIQRYQSHTKTNSRTTANLFCATAQQAHADKVYLFTRLVEAQNI